MSDDAATVALINRIESDLRALVYSEANALRESLGMADVEMLRAEMAGIRETYDAQIAELRSLVDAARENAIVATEAAEDAVEAAADAAEETAVETEEIADEVAEAVTDELPPALTGDDSEPRRKRGIGWTDKII